MRNKKRRTTGFSTSRAPGKPAEQELHLWVVRATQSHPRQEQLLSSCEHSRARKFHKSINGERWAYFRCALREILSQYTDLDPAELEFESIKNNKPVLKNLTNLVNFNLSHSHNRALVAIWGPGEIGVDIERVRALNDMDALAERNFSPEETQMLSRVPGQARCKLFYEIWTRKEAAIKANGRGLSIPLCQFTTPIGNAGQWQATTIPEHDRVKYLLCGLDLEPDYCTSLCIELPLEQTVRNPVISVHQYNLMF